LAADDGVVVGVFCVVDEAEDEVSCPPLDVDVWAVVAAAVLAAEGAAEAGCSGVLAAVAAVDGVVAAVLAIVAAVLVTVEAGVDELAAVPVLADAVAAVIGNDVAKPPAEALVASRRPLARLRKLTAIVRRSLARILAIPLRLTRSGHEQTRNSRRNRA